MNACDPILDTTACPQRPGAANGGACILCVDDEPQVLESLRLQLERHHRVLTATSGADGLQLLNEHCVAAIISDMRMPVMDGAAFLRRAREFAPDTPRILLTGQTDIGSAVSAVNQGQIFGFLLKPCAPAALAAAVTAAVGRYRLSKAQRTLQDVHQEVDPQHPEDALRRLFSAAVDLFGCRHAVLMIDSPDQDRQPLLLTCRLDEALFSPTALNGSTVIDQLRQQREAVHLRSATGAGPLQGLPAGHPEIWQLLGVPVGKDSGCGWLYFAEGRRAGLFGPDDLQAAVALAQACAHLWQAIRERRQAARQALELEAERVSRNTAEHRAERMTRAQNLLRTVIATRAAEPEALLQDVCRAAVLQGGFAQAWIARLDQGALRTIALHGADEQFAPRVEAALSSSTDLCVKELAVSIDQGRALIWNKQTHIVAPALRALTSEYGFHAVVAVPLAMPENAPGVLFLHAPEAERFDASEVGLLEAVSAEASRGLHQLALEQQIRRQASHDALTGLLTRKHFIERVEANLRSSHNLMVAAVSLDSVQHLQEVLGADARDAILQHLGTRLRDSLKVDEFAARVDQDRFALAIELPGQADDVEGYLQRRVLAPIAVPMQIGTKHIQIKGQLGFAVFPGDGGGADELLRNAELALGAAGGRTVPLCRYTQQLAAAVGGRVKLEESLRCAVSEGTLQVHYQPQVDLRSGAICGAEALLRWHSPELGWVPPARFVPVLEDTGLIHDVGLWVFHQVAHDVQLWQEAGITVPPIAVNVSAVQLHQPAFLDSVRETLCQTSRYRDIISLEITESTLIGDADETIAKLQSIRDLGISIAIDDFGTGYSSLSYLSRLPVSCIKIDRSFVSAIERGDRTIVSAIVSLAHRLGLHVVAEGVESQNELDVLRDLNCKSTQGFLFSASMNPMAFGELLRSGKTLPLNDHDENAAQAVPPQ